MIGGCTGTTIVKCYSNSSIKEGTRGTGGLIGVCNGNTSISMSGSSGDITALYDFAAGLIGIGYGNITINDVYSNCTVNDNEHSNGIAGLINLNSSTLNITNSYCTSKLGNCMYGTVQALINNYNSSATVTVKNCYWSPATSGVNVSSYGTKVNTLAEMQQQSTYNGFDFESGTVWEMGTFPEIVF